ncbi:MAG: DUF169 domain-containing protein, partial [Deltaproteobacteria bacterium]|nr:DUF169 domain-containing protein [Deltaproteobacteria bacterium]
AELPIAFYYTDRNNRGEMVPEPSGHQCLIGVLNKVRNGRSLCFGADSLGCGGAKRYLGYAAEIMPGFEYFLSCGIEGRVEGERYKKSPEIVKEIMKKVPFYEAPSKYIVFKRWDQLSQEDEPDVVVFFAQPDVLSGLFTLTGFEEVESDGVITPFAAGCGSIVMYPYQEKQKERQRGVIGMFDVSARPYVDRNELTLAVPMEKFASMIHDMDDSFLITPSWDKVRGRLNSN